MTSYYRWSRMPMLGAAVILLLGLSSACAIEATSSNDHTQQVTITTAKGPVSTLVFSAPHDGKRPAVIILHGRQGIARFATAYHRYAKALAAKGIDAILASYYDAADIGPMSSADQSSRERYFSDHLTTWSERVHDVVTFVAQRENFSGKVGILGFSNGGFLAVASAAADPRVDALVVFYAGLAGPTAPTRLPPLLELHGDADRAVPVSSGDALVKTARRLGGGADQVVYPSAGHGFDFNTNQPDAADALARAVTFFVERLR